MKVKEMEQVEVCNSWEEFDDNSKLLEQQLEKLKLQKERTNIRPDTEDRLSSLETPSPNVPEAPPKMRILKRTEAPSKPEVTNGISAASTNTNGVGIDDESMRTQYVPPEPRISILSRPKKKSPEDTSPSSSSQSKNKNQPLKTLEQREQEYAEARRRIFGDDAVEAEGENIET